MFAAVTLFAAWLGWEMKYIRSRASFLVEHDCRSISPHEQLSPGSNGRFHFDATGRLVLFPDASVAFWRRWLGDTPSQYVILPRMAYAANREQAQSLFPEAEVITE